MTILHMAVGLSLLSTLAASAQTPTSDLEHEITAGRVALTGATSTGHSSGGAVYGTLVNRTTGVRRVAVHLTRALYLMNDNQSRQNMVATQVYLRDGGYVTDGRSSFIELRPNQRTEVMFVAYCADFAKDNPAPTDRFRIAPGPADLIAVGRKIAAFQAADPDQDITTAAQVAVWLSQGYSLEKIREQFDFTEHDVVTARRILR